jgi:hypothetical protein
MIIGMTLASALVRSSSMAAHLTLAWQEASRKPNGCLAIARKAHPPGVFVHEARRGRLGRRIVAANALLIMMPLAFFLTIEFDAAFYAVQAVELVGVVQLVIASDFAVA